MWIFPDILLGWWIFRILVKVLRESLKIMGLFILFSYIMSRAREIGVASTVKTEQKSCSLNICFVLLYITAAPTPKFVLEPSVKNLVCSW